MGSGLQRTSQSSCGELEESSRKNWYLCRAVGDGCWCVHRRKQLLLVDRTRFDVPTKTAWGVLCSRSKVCLDIYRPLSLRCEHEGELEIVDISRQRCSGYSIWRLLETHTSVVAWAGLMMEGPVVDGLAGAVLTLSYRSGKSGCSNQWTTSSALAGIQDE